MKRQFRQPPALCAQSGRIRLCLRASWQGADLRIALAGGAAHVGAIALGEGGQARVLEARGHREGALAREIAAAVSGALACNVVVCAGIHYDDIARAEIDAVLRLARQLANSLVKTVQMEAENADNGAAGEL